MARHLEFFFDFMSPYSYLASTRVEALAARAGATLEWKVCYLPGVMRATENKGPTAIAAKLAYTVKDLGDWAAHYGLPPIRIPDSFPFQAANADRAALVVGPAISGFVHRTFHRIWADGADINAPGVLEGLVRDVGLDPAVVLPLANSEETRAKLRVNTDQAVARGAYGVPTMYVGEEMFVGNDRLDFVERALLRLPQ